MLHTPLLKSATVAIATCTLVFAQSALAKQVIVDVFAGSNPAAIAARYGIIPERVFTEIANAFTADLSAKQIVLLKADKDVEQVATDGIAGRIPRGAIRPLGPGAGLPPATLPGQPAQFVTAAMRRVGANRSVTADIDGIDDRRVDADIAILDGGVDPWHPDLNVVGGIDCVRGRQSQAGYYDRDGHGTLVAGFAAAIDNEIGVVGVAPGARIWAVRIADPAGYVADSALMCGLEYAARNRRIDVANLSFAGQNVIGPCRDEARRVPRKKVDGHEVDKIHQRICQLVTRGVTVVAAAGNSSADAKYFTPAAYAEVITVSAIADFDGLPGGLAATPPQCYYTERDDYLATFSNFGEVVDLAAPGVCVSATFPGGYYAMVEGTSFAAPMVAGAAALLYARNPGIKPQAVRRLLIDNAEQGPILGDSDGFDEGVLDVSEF